MLFNKYSVEAKESVPMLDHVQQGVSMGLFEDYTQIARKKRLKFLVLRTPELAGMLWDIAEDICGNIDFIGLSGSGRNRELGAKKWARNVRYREQLLAKVFDVLATGEGYAYLGAKESEIATQIDKMKNVGMKDRLYDEAVLNPQFRPIASQTMTIRYDDYDIVGYTQVVNGRNIVYGVREIIHLFFKRMAGRVEGYTPVMTIPLQLELLWLLWSNQLDLQAKGNMPDMVVVAEEIRSNTPALKDVEQKLRKYNTPGNSKHGTTVLYGGKYSFEKMERDTTLQFADVGQAVTSVIAGLFRYPKHRLGVKTKESSTEKDAQGNGDRDYWDMISKYQDKLADIYNTQLFEPFMGVELVFDKSYKHNEIVENTAMRARIDNVNLFDKKLNERGKQLTKEDIMRFVAGKHVDFSHIKLEEFEPPTIEQEETPGAGTPEGNKDKNLSRQKKQEQTAQEVNTGGVNRQ